MWQLGTWNDTVNVYIRTSVWPISMGALTILHKGRQHSTGCCNNLLWVGIHTFYVYVLQLTVRHLSLFYPPYSKRGARNVFHWLVDAPNEHVHWTCKLFRHYILNDLLLIIFSVRTVTVNFILWHALHIKLHGFKYEHGGHNPLLIILSTKMLC